MIFSSTNESKSSDNDEYAGKKLSLPGNRLCFEFLDLQAYHMNKTSQKIVNYYEFFGIDPKAGFAEIKQAYRTKLKEWHRIRTSTGLKKPKKQPRF